MARCIAAYNRRWLWLCTESNISLLLDWIRRPSDIFPALKSLALRAPNLQDLGPSPLSCSLLDTQALFPALRDIHFGVTTIEFAIEFLDMLSNCCLVNLYVGTPAAVTSPITRQLYAALTSRLSHLAHETLQVHVWSECALPTPPFANYVVDGHILAGLFSFVNLTEILLTPVAGFDIDDATAWDIARAWPKLESLYLAAATDLYHPPSMSLHGLRAFAKHCPELTSLTITLDASTVPPADEAGDTAISQSSLTNLGADRSPITDVPAVAQFMSRLFPSLANIATHDSWMRWDRPDLTIPDDNMNEEDRRDAQWKRVEAMLQNLKASDVVAS